MNSDYLGILGYSDDNLLIAPSEDALQEMLETCEDYAAEHNLKFSTDSNPRLSKTRCVAFLHRDRQLKKMRLCGNNLPWETTAKHLGNKIENVIDGLKKDMREKRARYISRNNEILQEFGFAHPKTKFNINKIFNSHFSGQVLWDLFSREAEMIENTWNVSFRIMFNLPRNAKKFLVEPVSQSEHIKKTFIKRFLSFIEKIKTSNKIALKNVFNVVKHDCQSVTGSNLRNIMLMVDKNRITDLDVDDASKISYHEIPQEELWRVDLVNQLVDAMWGECTVEGFSRDELEYMLGYASAA